MPIIKTKLQAQSASFKDNAQAMSQLTQTLTEIIEAIVKGGSEKARQRHTEQGKWLPRDRIAALLDKGSPFLELSMLAAYGVYEDPLPAAGIITGIGYVQG